MKYIDEFRDGDGARHIAANVRMKNEYVFKTRP